MNRFLIAATIAALYVVIISGCSQTPDQHADANDNPAEASEASTAPPELIVRRDEVTSERETEAAPNTRTSTSAQSLAQLITSLTEQAHRLENEMKYAAAAEVWDQLAEHLAGQFGNDAWQVQNARFSKRFAEQASRLNTDQKRQLQRIGQLNRQVQQLVKQGDLAAAVTTAVESRELLKQILPNTDFTFARQSVEIGAIQSALGQHDAAIDNFQFTLHRLHQLGLELHPDLERAHAGLAAAALASGDVGLALANQKEATRIAGQLWGDRSTDYALQANQLGVYYHRAGQHDTALKILRASEVIRRNHLGEKDPQVGHSRFNIGVVLMDMKRYDEALDNFQQAEQILLAAEKPDWNSVAQCQSKMATIYMLNGHLVPAESMLQSALTNLEQVAAADPIELNRLRYRLAVTLAKQGKYDRAQPMLENLVQWQRSTLGNHPDTLKSIQALQLVLKQTGQSEAANRWNQEAQRMAQSLPESTRFRR